MPDFTDLLRKWWKPMILLVILALTTTFIFTLLTPKKYLAVTTAVPASSFESDRSRIFSENIQALYSSLGTPDDLDLIIGTANLDTVYLSVADELGLENHYKISEQGESARRKIATILRKNSKVFKTGYGELKVKAWDRDIQLPAQIANAIMNKLRSIHQDLQSESNRATLQTLKSEKDRLQGQNDSAGTGKRFQYDELISQYELLVNSRPPVIMIIEKARTPVWPDKPKMINNLVLTAGIALVFAVLLALVLQGKQNNKQ